MPHPLLTHQLTPPLCGLQACWFQRYIYIVISCIICFCTSFLGHCLWWPSRLELRCVHRYIRPQSFLIWCVGRPRPHMCTSVTSTRSKVRVKVTELPKLQKLHFSKSISSTILALSSKLMVGGDSMGPGLQLVRARFSNFLLQKLSRQFRVLRMSTFHEIQMAIFR